MSDPRRWCGVGDRPIWSSAVHDHCIVRFPTLDRRAGQRFFTRPSSTLGQGKYSTCTCKLSVGHRGASSWTGKHAVSGETLARTAVVLKREREREHESTGGAAFDDLSRLMSPVGTVSC